MREKVSEYVNALTTKDTTGYELAARESATYFDERGIDMPTAENWKEYAAYFVQKYEQEKGKRPSEYTVQQNYVARGKAFYRWCASHDGSHQTASLFEEDKPEASAQPKAEAEETDAPSKRVNLLIDESLHSALMSLVYLKGQTLTAILTEAIKAYVDVYSEEIATLEETRRKLRSQ